MGMYNILFGRNPQAQELLAVAGLDMPPRFRDAWIDDDQEGVIAVYTRMGGGNYDCWEENADPATCDCSFHVLVREFEGLPSFVLGKDDDFDNTYRTLFFRLPSNWRERLSAVGASTEARGEKAWPATREEWEQLIDDKLKRATP